MEVPMSKSEADPIIEALEQEVDLRREKILAAGGNPAAAFAFMDGVADITETPDPATQPTANPMSDYETPDPQGYDCAVTVSGLKNPLGSWHQGRYQCPNCRTVVCVASAGVVLCEEEALALAADTQMLVTILGGGQVHTVCTCCEAKLRLRRALVQHASALPAGCVKGGAVSV
jgi:hypothetical protein